jgi:predicted phage tail protein
MLRTIKLYGSLEKVAGNSTLSFDCDNQQQLFAFFRSFSPAMNLAVRSKLIGLVGSDENDENLEGIRSGFSFGEKAKTIHVLPMTEGAQYVWAYIAEYVYQALIVAAVSYIVTRLTMSSINTNPNGPGGKRSTMFNGPVNSTDQGGAIPIICGKKYLVGSTIMAADETYSNYATSSPFNFEWLFD